MPQHRLFTLNIFRRVVGEANAEWLSSLAEQSARAPHRAAILEIKRGPINRVSADVPDKERVDFPRESNKSRALLTDSTQFIVQRTGQRLRDHTM